MKVTEASHIKAGTKLTCPACGDSIARLRVTLHPGMVLSVDKVDILQEKHADDKSMTCTKCGAAFGRFVLHTEDGWK